ncbi:MAG: phosphate regulon transcriptional regulator PhoB [Rhodospirillales bacterium]|jgi:two-component system phosphate regulon response regulator PhoB|tara:strand:+ start:763 stop:1458 length:696 start_codon:yes stop_codon:yes gene_type:complete
MKAHILIVEDDPSLSELLAYNFDSAGLTASVVSEGDEALPTIIDERPDLIILDWMLPNLSGIEICRQIRQHADINKTPIIMLTAKGEEAERIRGLETGADDYVIKPFSPSELIARVKAVLRRTHPEKTADILEFGDISMNLEEHRVSRNGQYTHLGPTEYRLLRVFLEKPGRVFSREQLLDRVWGRDIYVEPRTVDVHIRRLRKAMQLPGTSNLIRTVRAAGYSIDIPLTS